MRSLIIVLVSFLLSCSQSDGDTVEGFDLNKDGIRDDVEMFIKENVADTTVQSMYGEMAKGYQQIIEDPTNNKLHLDMLIMFWEYRNVFKRNK